ncbi:hypothetical protein V1264_023309 [Littorina saxatilis]|uniref:Integrase catalytic domain-containing protein n=1 Tax=Littorina saxatilis TaxID=31220 RepID=A0AAN9G9X4_9CAEN
MMLRIENYNITVHYKKGKEMHLADTLSRAYINAPSRQEDFEFVNMVSFLPIREERLAKLKVRTENDENLQLLKTTIMTGWPDDRNDLPATLTPYFHFRDEMTVQDGLIFKGERVVVPESMRGEMKTAVHSTHSGIDGCLKRARECLFWPGMSGDIKNFISTCETCNTYQSANQPETLMPHELPSRQWEKVGVDLFELDGKDYMVTTDYFSNFWEIDRLENTTSSTVIKKLKAHIARYGSPCILVSDNGPQFTSENFQEFARSFDFEHRTSSPYNSKANGKAESSVKTAKALLRKNKEGDQFLALLNYGNTPSQATGTSPAQRFFNRRTRTLLPTTATLLKPKVDLDTEKKKLRAHQKKQKTNFDKGAKDLPHLEEGDTVRMQYFTLGHKKWTKAVVTKRLDDRSYEIQANGSLYRRNRVHLKKTAESASPEPSADSACNRPQQPPPTPCPTATETTTTPQPPAKMTPQRHQPEAPVKPSSPSKIPVSTRSGRTVKCPKMKDFVYIADK